MASQPGAARDSMADGKTIESDEYASLYWDDLESKPPPQILCLKSTYVLVGHGVVDVVAHNKRLAKARPGWEVPPAKLVKVMAALDETGCPYSFVLPSQTMKTWLAQLVATQGMLNTASKTLNLSRGLPLTDLASLGWKDPFVTDPKRAELELLDVFTNM